MVPEEKGRQDEHHGDWTLGIPDIHQHQFASVKTDIEHKTKSGSWSASAKDRMHIWRRGCISNLSSFTLRTCSGTQLLGTSSQVSWKAAVGSAYWEPQGGCDCEWWPWKRPRPKHFWDSQTFKAHESVSAWSLAQAIATRTLATVKLLRSLFGKSFIFFLKGNSALGKKR